MAAIESRRCPSLIDVRLDAGVEWLELISVADFIAEVEIGAAMPAQARGVHFKLVTVEGAGSD